jgi:two-component system sensor histidine kinase/response regulator
MFLLQKNAIAAILCLFVLFALPTASIAQPKKIIDSLQTLLQQKHEDTTRLAIMNQLSQNLMFHLPDSSLKLSEQVIEMAAKNKDKKNEAQAHINIASVYLRRGSVEAEKYLLTALKLNKSINNKKGITACLNNLGIFHTNQGTYPKALDYTFQAIKLQDTLTDHKTITKILINIGNVYLQQDQFETARKYFIEAEKMNEKSMDKSSISSINMNFGYIYDNQDKLEQSLFYYRKSLHYSLLIKHKFRVADILGNLGVVYEKMQQYDSALYYNLESLKMHEELGEKYNRARNLANIARIKNLTGKTTESIQYAKKGLILAQEIQNLQSASSAANVLATIYKKQGNYKDALAYHEIATIANDTLHNTEKTKALKNLQHEYEIEKHQAEIDLLNKDKIIQQDKLQLKETQQHFYTVGLILATLTAFFLYWLNNKRQHSNKLLRIKNAEINQQKEEIQTQAEALDDLNHTKDKVFAIISHDLRSPLNNLNMTLQLFDNQFLSPEELRHFTREIRKNVDTIKDTLDNLLNWSIAQLQGLEIVVESLNIHDLGNEAIALYREIADKKNIRLINEANPQAVIKADRNHIRLVLRNLISNAIKFTNADGEITLTTHQKQDNPTQQNYWEVCVNDTGIGMTPEQSYKLFKSHSHFTSYGTANEKGTGVGLLLCKEFIERNGGIIGVDSKIGRGSRFFFTIPAEL